MLREELILPTQETVCPQEYKGHNQRQCSIPVIREQDKRNQKHSLQRGQSTVQRQITDHHIKEEKFANVTRMIIKESDLNIALVYRLKVAKEIKVVWMIMETSLHEGKGLTKSRSEKCWRWIKRASQLFRTGV